MDFVAGIKDAVMSGKLHEIQSMVQEALNGGARAEDILQSGFIEAMDVIGGKMSNDEIFIPEVLAAAKTMQVGLELLKPHLMAGETNQALVVCTNR